MGTSRGTTPTYKLTLPDTVDLTGKTVYVTFADKNYKKIIEKTNADLEIDENIINVFMTQAETLKFPLAQVMVQVNWVSEDSGNTVRGASVIKQIPTCRNLKEEVIAP